MKKLFALSLAALMVMGLATTAFAAPNKTITIETGTKAVLGTSTSPVNGVLSDNAVALVSTHGFGENTDNIVEIVVSGVEKSKTYIAPGKTMYYPLLNKLAIGVSGSSSTPDTTVDNGVIWTNFPAAAITLSDAVKSVSISTKYTLGQSEIESPKVVYKKYADGGNSGYAYFLAITAKESTSLSTKDFAADITIKKSSGEDKTGKHNALSVAGSNTDKSLAFETKVNSSFEIKYTNYDKTNLVNSDSTVGLYIVDDSYNVHNFKDIDDDQTIEFRKFNSAYFEVDVTGQEKLLIKADAKYDAAVAGKYATANINFFNGYGATFNKIGELHLPAESGSYLYAVAADGTLSKVNAEYDDGEEAFIIKTRTLGKYAISDKELNVGAAVVEPSESVPSEAPSEPATVAPAPADPNKSNPGTGAAA